MNTDHSMAAARGEAGGGGLGKGVRHTVTGTEGNLDRARSGAHRHRIKTFVYLEFT